MKNTGMRVTLLIFGILMMILGIIMFATPGMNSVAMAYIVCILMAVYGIAEIVYYVKNNDNRAVSGWLLADGIITTILGILLLFVPGAQIMTLTLLFTMWVLFTGVTRISASFAAKDLGSSSWGWTLAAGIIGVLLGIWLMFDPLLAVMTIGFIMPVVFLMQGISAVAAFFATSNG